MKLQVEAGGEKFVKWAKQRLAMLTGLRKELRLPVMQKDWMIDGSLIHVRSTEFGDTIYITASGSWSYYILNINGAATAFDGQFVTVDKKTIKLISGNILIQNRAVVTGEKAMLVYIDINQKWKWIDSKLKIADYKPNDFVGVIQPPFFDKRGIDATENRPIVSFDGNVSSGTYILTDGINSVSVTGINPPYTLATASDGFMIDSTRGTRLKIVSLAESQRKDSSGSFVNPTGVLLDIPFSGTFGFLNPPVTNYTDQFSLFSDDPTLIGATNHIYIRRNGAQEYVSTNTVTFSNSVFLGDTQAPKDRIFSFSDKEGFISPTNFGSSSTPAHVIVIQGARQSDGTYIYAESSVLISNTFCGKGGGGQIAFIVGQSMIGATIFLVSPRDISSGAGSTVDTLVVINSDGSVVEVLRAPSPGNSVTAPIFNPSGPIAFKNYSFIVGVRQVTSSKFDHVYFVRSDGLFIEVVLPTANTSNPGNSLPISGSKTVAYVYLEEILGATTDRYIASSDGKAILLDVPPPKPATSTTSAKAVLAVIISGFIDQKIGCRLLFIVVYADSTASHHHWDENGKIFTYDSTTAFAVNNIPVPSSISRMKLLDKWG